MDTFYHQLPLVKNKIGNSSRTSSTQKSKAKITLIFEKYTLIFETMLLIFGLIKFSIPFFILENLHFLTENVSQWVGGWMLKMYVSLCPFFRSFQQMDTELDNI